MCHSWIKCLAVWFLLMVADGSTVMPTRAPLFPHKAFVVVWNAPTEQCRLRYKVDLDLNIFNILSNPNETLSGSTVTIFYHTRLGYYPYFNDDGDPINGGIPQNQSIIKHLTKAKSDIDHSIAMRKFHGLGVIDWENWRPQWDRNWGLKAIYRNKSLELVKTRHPLWPKNAIRKAAKEEFENAGKSFMNSTLSLAENMRPSGLWGYYLYPDCYNYDYKTKANTYTGKCPDIASSRNDLLLWLWKESTALYPSIYLEYMLKSSPNALKFVHYRVKEAIRIASIARKDYALPVFVYSRPFYAYTFQALTEIDLVHTIGESAALGAAGVILWGSMQYASTYHLLVRFSEITTLEVNGALFELHYFWGSLMDTAQGVLEAIPNGLTKHLNEIDIGGIIEQFPKGHYFEHATVSSDVSFLERIQIGLLKGNCARWNIPYENCLTVKKYVDGPLGHYIVNVTSAAKLCSKVLCTKNGRCIRKNSELHDYLHLHPQSFKIKFFKTMKKVFVEGELTMKDWKTMKEKFMCQCYQGWTGKYCEMPSFKKEAKIYWQ